MPGLSYSIDYTEQKNSNHCRDINPRMLQGTPHWLSSLESVNNPSFGEVVGSHLYFDLITYIEADIVHTHFS